MISGHGLFLLTHTSHKSEVTPVKSDDNGESERSIGLYISFQQIESRHLNAMELYSLGLAFIDSGYYTKAV